MIARRVQRTLGRCRYDASVAKCGQPRSRRAGPRARTTQRLGRDASPFTSPRSWRGCTGAPKPTRARRAVCTTNNYKMLVVELGCRPNAHSAAIICDIQIRINTRECHLSPDDRRHSVETEITSADQLDVVRRRDDAHNTQHTDAAYHTATVAVCQSTADTQHRSGRS